MVDVATVSVVASATVALGTIVVNFVGGERQRKHETDLDFEGRVWERKSEVLFSLMEECRFLADSDAPLTDENRETYALNLSKSLDRLHKGRAAVEAFASNRCRTELNGLIEEMLAWGVKYDAGANAERYQALSFETDIHDIDGRRRWRGYENMAKAKAVENFDPDLADLRARALRLLDAARESVRRPKD